MSAFVPVYFRLPNKFIRYEVRRSHLKCNHRKFAYDEIVAIYVDKSKKEVETTAQVKWITVWDLNRRQFVPLEEYMRYVPNIRTEHIDFDSYYPKR